MRTLTVVLSMGTLAMAPCLAADVFRCTTADRVVYQSLPCPPSSSDARRVTIAAAPAPAQAPPHKPATPHVAPPSTPPVAEVPANAPAAQPATKAEDPLGAACMAWYRKRHPFIEREWEDMRYERGMLSFKLIIPNGKHRYSKPAACEFRNGVVDDMWTQVHARRHEW